MNDPKDLDTTRILSVSDDALWDSPAIDADSQELCVVLAFHPDTSRIGEVCSLGYADDLTVFGRHRPQFAHLDGSPARGCDDEFVSREAFSLSYQSSLWQLVRREGSSRLRIDGRELLDAAVLSPEQLQNGVVLTVAERIVLHLRLRSSRVSVSTSPELAVLRGVSPAMQQLRESTDAAAKSGGDVLLIGPTGTGKERIAGAIHALSRRSGEPWVAVNMAAMPVDLASASLFGAAKGAYTGADANRKGFFQQANGGTLFLDEVGDTPPLLQPMLLRALQEREIQVVGGKSERVALRVIAAMEQDPDQLRETFRPALRYRLGAYEVHLPCLKERSEDVALLAADFFNEQAGEAGLSWDVQSSVAGVSAWARLFEQFLLYSWPGNIRELQHVVAQISSVSRGDLRVPSTIRERFGRPLSQLSEAKPAPQADLSEPEPTQIKESAARRLDEVSDEEFVEAWRDAKHEVAAVAKDLGVSRPAVYRRLKGLRECRLAADVPLGELLSALDACRGDLSSTAERLAVSRRGLQTRLRASGVASANLSDVFEGEDRG
ncbi:sigma 54-interacting transcriptional regulator [Congregibacter brevis]|uniref:Sigma 54-interacting transcriptional regulator n=1 Tax=Congregibacter brevis TaxID=3081201 RepID=A0ABZ0IHV4_9GAMM|nr:sigma 54-interacting transcriptional regulator [Congregibacter sp. IMCC45268]